MSEVILDAQILLKRGLEADLPASAAEGEPLITTDSHKLYIGTGSGIAEVAGGSGAVTSVAGRTGAVVLGESDVANLTSDLSTLTSAISAEATSRTSGDSAAVTTSEAYTDTKIATEVTNRNSAIATEATARASADTAAIATAEGYTDSSIAAEVTNRNTAIGVETTRATAAESTLTTAVSTETTRAETAEALLAPLASPALTGNPTVPTQSALNNSTRAGSTAYTDSAVAVETSRAQTAEALSELLSHKDAANGYPSLDADSQLPAAELPGWVTEGVNNSIVNGPVDGSNNPDFVHVATVSTVATATVQSGVEAWITGRYNKTVDTSLTVVLNNGFGSPNFIYLKQRTSSKSLQAGDVGVTTNAFVFGNNRTAPSSAAATSSNPVYWFDTSVNKWKKATSNGGSFVEDPIVPLAVASVDSSGNLLAIGYWPRRWTPWKVMEVCGQGTDGAINRTTTSGSLGFGWKQYTSIIASGGALTSIAGIDGRDFSSAFSQAPILVCPAGSITTSNGKTVTSGAATGAGAAGAAGGFGGAGGGGGGSTAAGGTGGTRFVPGFGIFGSSTTANAGGAGASGSSVGPTAGGNGAGSVGPHFIAVWNPGSFVGAGGGGGSGDGSAASGGLQAAGGGIIYLRAPGMVIAASGVVSANGGNGGDGGGTNGAGAGGGGGGAVILYCGYFSISGTLSAAGGAGGNGKGTGKNGGNGGAGIAQQTLVF